MRRIFLTAALLLTSLPAWAGGIAIVDFQEAINQVSDGDRARQEIESQFQQKQQAITNLERQFQVKLEEYEKQKIILSDAARAQKEQELMQLEAQLRQLAQQAEMEMQQLYTNKMESLITKMRGISEQIGKEKGYDLVLEVTEGGVVYQGATVTDITAELIRRYNGG